MNKLTLDFKKQVYKACVNLVEEKNQLLHNELIAARESGNDETKSSAGDKHETGRAMAQLTQENLGKQLNQIQVLQQSLSGINPENTKNKVESGALVQTADMLIFIGIPLGQVSVNGKVVFAISLASPIGKILLGKKEGDTYSFRNKEMEILEIL